jgi:hypothetical protein
MASPTAVAVEGIPVAVRAKPPTMAARSSERRDIGADMRAHS